MSQIVLDFPASAFSALRKSPQEFVHEVRIAAAVQWYAEGVVSQEKAAEIPFHPLPSSPLQSGR